MTVLFTSDKFFIYMPPVLDRPLLKESLAKIAVVKFAETLVFTLLF